jgi:hypothetical protein
LISNLPAPAADWNPAAELSARRWEATAKHDPETSTTRQPLTQRSPPPPAASDWNPSRTKTITTAEHDPGNNGNVYFTSTADAAMSANRVLAHRAQRGSFASFKTRGQPSTSRSIQTHHLHAKNRSVVSGRVAASEYGLGCTSKISSPSAHGSPREVHGKCITFHERHRPPHRSSVATINKHPPCLGGGPRFHGLGSLARPLGGPGGATIMAAVA